MAGTTFVRISCSACDEVVSVVVPELLLAVARDARGRRSITYRFRCPACATFVRQPANRGEQTVLIRAGVSVVYEQPHPEPPPDPAAPPLTLDDVIDLHAELEWRPAADWG